MPSDLTSPILQALYRGDDAEARRLAAAGMPCDVFEAAALADAAALRALLRQTPALARETGADGFTPLHLAAFFGTPECVVALLAAGADPAVAAGNAMLVTPLHSAVSRRKTENVRALLQAGVPVDARQQGELTALHAAAHNGDRLIVEMLLSRGADRTIADAAGKTAAQHARDGGHDAIATVLEI
jgi:ankyrin repeat protein